MSERPRVPPNRADQAAHAEVPHSPFRVCPTRNIRPFRNQLPHLPLHTNRSRAHACSLESKAQPRQPCLNGEQLLIALTVDRLDMDLM